MNYLLSVENLKKLGLIHSNTDTKLLAVAIKRSQDMHIQPALGTPLYRALLDRVETNTWTQDYLDLMNDYVVPCLVAFVDYRAALFLTEKLTNKAAGRVSDENLQANTLDEVNELREAYKLDAMKFSKKQIDKLKAYLNKDGKNTKPANERAGNNSDRAQADKRILSR